MVYNHNTNERVIREGMGRTDLNLTSVKTAKKIGGFFAISAAFIASFDKFFMPSKSG